MTLKNLLRDSTYIVLIGTLFAFACEMGYFMAFDIPHDFIKLNYSILFSLLIAVAILSHFLH